jgi:hypothetical protein
LTRWGYAPRPSSMRWTPSRRRRSSSSGERWRLRACVRTCVRA